MTLTLRNENDTRPRFEYYPVNSPTLRTVVVADFPFVIGRGEGTQLQIHSTSISREHAQLTQTSSGYQLCDLNSTNGTAINGQPISEAPLEDGDSVSIAETELTFLCPARRQIASMATQPLAGKQTIDPTVEFANAILTSRSLAESLLWQAIPLGRTSVIDYQSESEIATFVSIDEPLASHMHATVASDWCSTASRIQQLAWQLTAEHADSISSAGTILMRVEMHSGFDERLCDALDQAFERLTSERTLGIVLPWEWAVQSPASLGLCSELRELGAELAFDHFSGGVTCIENMAVAPPDLLVLAPTLARGISSHPRRMNQLKTVVSKCEDAEIQIVLPFGLAEEDYKAGSDIGLNLIVSTDFAPINVHRPDAIHASV